MLDTCWFVVRAAGAAEVAEQRRRAERLAAFHGGSLAFVVLPEAGAVVGALRVGGEPPSVADGWCSWGSVFPLGPREAAAPATDGLRRWRGPGAIAGWTDDVVRLRTGSSEIASLYEAGGRAWSTHAVAAAYLAGGSVAVRPRAAAELLAFGHVAVSAVDGVRSVPPAAEVTVRADGADESSWWPRSERWALCGEASAHDVAAERLEEHLRHRAEEAPVVLGLSAGLDSRVVAAALARVEIPFTAYTWAEDEADVAAAVARGLGVEHRMLPAELLEDGEALPASVAAARWSDGATAFGLGAPSDALPEGAINLSGLGGEVGRAFYYAEAARSWSRPTPKRLRQAWRPEDALPAGASRAARADVGAAGDRAVADAADVPGADGWRVLDVAYCETRLRWWSRANIRATAGMFAPAFLEPGVASALVSLPLEDRLTDGFHRSYLARHAPQLAGIPLPPVRGLQRAGVPAPLRRLASRVRTRGGTTPHGGTDPTFARRWPAMHAHLAAVAADDLVAEGVGEEYAATLRAGVEDGTGASIAAALQFASLVALRDGAAAELT